MYITLLKPKGKGPQAVKYLKQLKAPKEISLQGVYLTFGRYDAVIIFDAPNNKTALDFVMNVATNTGYRAETLIAMSTK